MPALMSYCLTPLIFFMQQPNWLEQHLVSFLCSSWWSWPTCLGKVMFMSKVYAAFSFAKQIRRVLVVIPARRCIHVCVFVCMNEVHVCRDNACICMCVCVWRRGIVTAMAAMLSMHVLVRVCMGRRVLTAIAAGYTCVSMNKAHSCGHWC